MKLCDMTVTEFVNTVASDAPAPGGGSTAALAGALGAALTAMVCRLTEGRKKYEEYQEFVLEVKEKATALQAKFIDVMDRDTEAFMVISNAYGMPKATDEEKTAYTDFLRSVTEKNDEIELLKKKIEVATIERGRLYDSLARSMYGQNYERYATERRVVREEAAK